MILLIAVFLGLLAGVIRARYNQKPLTIPNLRLTWLVLLAFIPQFLVFNFPLTRNITNDNVAATTLITSDLILLIFVWFNRYKSGLWLLGSGLFFNFLVIALNGGLMPISPEVVKHLSPNLIADKLAIGTRLGWNVVLPGALTRLWWLSDHLVTPTWFIIQKALSPGDLLIAVGAFWFLWSMGEPPKTTNGGSNVG